MVLLLNSENIDLSPIIEQGLPLDAFRSEDLARFFEAFGDHQNQLVFPTLTDEQKVINIRAVTVHYSKLFRLFGAILMWVSCNNIFFLFHIIRDSVSIPVILSSTLRSLELMLTKMMTK